MTLRSALAAALGLAALAASAPTSAETITLPGIRYEVLASGPATGAHPTRSDRIQMRYIGRLENGAVFSTSPEDGKGVSTFGVNQVIPGMSAALQLMRPGDHWRITMPPYLAYGPGRPLNTPPPAGAAAGQTVQKQGIPPNATLIFDVDLVGIAPAQTP